MTTISSGRTGTLIIVYNLLEGMSLKAVEQLLVGSQGWRKTSTSVRCHLSISPFSGLGVADTENLPHIVGRGWEEYAESPSLNDPLSCVLIRWSELMSSVGRLLVPWTCGESTWGKPTIVYAFRLK